MNSNQLRRKFLDFFSSKDHKILASDSLVPKDDPTLLFTTAGMNQFKKQFLGNIADFKRAATSQKCLRTDDLDKVGKTPSHHTFFEMLGNFSFGDYFKQEAIAWTWEFLTKVLKLSPKKLWVSVYCEDDEAYGIWSNKIKIPKNRIIKLGDKENFWPAEAKTKGPNGPCGSCSEVFYDYGKNIGCGKKGCNPACDCGRFVEVWNLVFTQFNRRADATLEPLPSKNIDTGMGLERLAAVMQGVYNNFDTDLFVPIINSIKREAGINKPNKAEGVKISIIADHVRAIVFAICDGVNPSNEERGYIVRKLIRIGVNNYRNLDIKRPFLYKIVPSVVDVMKEPYPELLSRRENIADIVKREEESFLRVIQKQDVASKEKMKALAKQHKDSKILARKMAQLAFELHDTYGYPFESTKETADKLNIGIDRATFDRLMQGQKERSRKASAMGGDVFVDSDIKLNLKDTKFDGYKNTQLNAKIIKILDNNNKEIKSTKDSKDIKIILDKTPFYGESGGQVGDKGFIQKADKKIEVTDTKTIDGVIVHIAKLLKGNFKVNDNVRAVVDYKRRLAIARNHTATHLLQAALRKVLGEHVQQQGSLVEQDRLRFDFTHFKAISNQELDRIEEIVNEFIMGNTPLKTGETQLDKAKKSGALAFFAEKYEDKVRVVSIGDYSKELCGGTHLSYTGQIGLFKIISEGSIAQGIRRIEAVTGEAAYKLIKDEKRIINEILDMLKVGKERFSEQIKKTISNQKDLQKKLDNSRMEILKKSIPDIIAKSEEVDGVKIISYRLDDADMNFLRSAVDLVKQKVSSAVITIGSVKDEKVYIAMGISGESLQKGLNASELIKQIAEIVEGSGGGRADFAQAGGNNPSKVEEALLKIREIVKVRLGK